MKARARNTDPAPSHEAADRVQPHITEQAAGVLKLIGRARGGYTAAMLDESRKNRVGESDFRVGYIRCIYTRYQISRRLPDLEAAGLIERLPKGICPIKNVSMTFWRRK